MGEVKIISNFGGQGVKVGDHNFYNFVNVIDDDLEVEGNINVAVMVEFVIVIEIVEVVDMEQRMKAMVAMELTLLIIFLEIVF